MNERKNTMPKINYNILQILKWQKWQNLKKYGIERNFRKNKETSVRIKNLRKDIGS